MTKRLKIVNVVGARPNFIKLAPLYKNLKKVKRFKPILVHTGQHYDYEMSKIFFEGLSLPRPDYHLKTGSGTHTYQIAKIMQRFESVLKKESPDLIVVYGDVNSTLACTIVARKMNIKIAHVESGLRSFDHTMPEEINRKVTDCLSDYLFTPSYDAALNLKKEGIKKKQIYMVGNIMIDSLVTLKRNKKAKAKVLLDKLGLKRGKYCLVTLHRPSNVDNKITLQSIITKLDEIAFYIPVIFPIHPRTSSKLREYNIKHNKIKLIKPLGYFEFIELESSSKVVITDSGGIQEETTFLNVPCLTLRSNTERPITIIKGTNKLTKIESLMKDFISIMKRKPSNAKTIRFWDGKTSKRIVTILKNELK